MEENDDEAEKWYQKAAEQGCLSAMKHLIEFSMYLDYDGSAGVWAEEYADTATEDKGYGYYKLALLAQENDNTRAEFYARKAVELGISSFKTEALKRGLDLKFIARSRRLAVAGPSKHCHTQSIGL